jgi:hypothetical protein
LKFDALRKANFKLKLKEKREIWRVFEKHEGKRESISLSLA